MLATITLLLVGPVLAPRDEPQPIQGVARVAGTDRPAAGVALHVFDQTNPANVVVTDDQGRFVAPRNSGRAPAPDGERESACWAEAQRPARWTVEAVQQPGYHQPPESLLGNGALGPGEARRGNLAKRASSRSNTPSRGNLTSWSWGRTASRSAIAPCG